MKLYKFRDVEECISVLFLIFAGFYVNKHFKTKSIFLGYRSAGFNNIFKLTVDEKCMFKASFNFKDVDPMVASEIKFVVN